MNILSQYFMYYKKGQIIWEYDNKIDFQSVEFRNFVIFMKFYTTRGFKGNKKFCNYTEYA